MTAVKILKFINCSPTYDFGGVTAVKILKFNNCSPTSSFSGSWGGCRFRAKHGFATSIYLNTKEGNFTLH